MRIVVVSLLVGCGLEDERVWVDSGDLSADSGLHNVHLQVTLDMDAEDPAHIWPRPPPVELCNGIDDDGDGLVDEHVQDDLYADEDEDGWGDGARPIRGCRSDPRLAERPGDCNDLNPWTHPGVDTDDCDGEDSDCDGEIDEDSKPGWSLLTIDAKDDMVYAIDPDSAKTEPVCALDIDGRINSMDVSEKGLAIAHDFHGDDGLSILEPCSGTATPLGPHGSNGVGGIGFGPDERLFGIGSQDQLLEFDTSTGQAEVVGELGIDIGNSGLAWDCTHSTMYGADALHDRIFEIDLETGQAMDVRAVDIPFENVGLEFDHRSGLLYASTQTKLYTIDPVTGDTAFVGHLDAGNVDDLAWHPVCH